MLATVLLAANLVTLAHDRPSEIPSDKIVSQWPRVSGVAMLDGARVHYELYVEPTRPMLYAITRYRIRPAGGGAPHNEILIWNSRPGQRQSLRCFERVSRPLKGGEGVEWVAVQSDTDPYRNAMMTAIRVYYVYQAVLERAAEEARARGEGDLVR